MGFLAGVAFSVMSPGFADEANPPEPHWTSDDMPDLAGKVFIVTGGNTGMGYETVKALLNHNAKVYLAARSPEKGNAAIQKLSQETGKNALFLQLDLGDLASVKRAAEDYKSKESKLHVLMNNAGVMMAPKDQFTAQGWDLQFGTNTIGPFFLTKLLTPLLIETAKECPPGTVRVVNTGSSAQHWSPIHFDALKAGSARDKLCDERLYGQSKHGNTVFSQEFARRYGNTGIVSTCLSPGGVDTDLARHLSPLVVKLTHGMLASPERGAVTQLWAATSEEGREFNGKDLKPWARVGKGAAGTDDPELGKKLWDVLEDAVREFL